MKYDLSHIENLPEGLDPEIVSKTHQGKGWGAQDQARYDAMIKKRGEAKGQAQQYINNRPQNQGGKSPFNENLTDIANTQTQTVTQDNDQTSNITGDDNYVYQQQDNSIRNYGGDNRSFVYNSNGEGPDTPATMATLAGYYAPDDSPAAKAKRLDQAVTMNRDNQKKYADTSYIAQGATSRAKNNAYIDPAGLDKRIAQREQYSRDKSQVMSSQLFGDMGNFMTPNWNSSDPAKPVKAPDFEEMYDKYKP